MEWMLRRLPEKKKVVFKPSKPKAVQPKTRPVRPGIKPAIRPPKGFVWYRGK